MTQRDPKDPRFKVARRVTLGIYLAFSVTFCCLVIYSVVTSVLAMSPSSPPQGELLAEAQCLADLRSLYLELDERRKKASEGSDVAHADQRFLSFRLDWLNRLRALEAGCGLDSRRELKDTFSRLEHVLDLYTTTSVQFAGQVGPAVDELKGRLGL